MVSRSFLLIHPLQCYPREGYFIAIVDSFASQTLEVPHPFSFTLSTTKTDHRLITAAGYRECRIIIFFNSPAVYDLSEPTMKRRIPSNPHLFFENCYQSTRNTFFIRKGSGTYFPVDQRRMSFGKDPCYAPQNSTLCSRCYILRFQHSVRNFI